MHVAPLQADHTARCRLVAAQNRNRSRYRLRGWTLASHEGKIIMHRHYPRISLLFLFLVILWGVFLVRAVFGEEPPKPTTQCPNPGEPCKVLIVTQQRENFLMIQNGVLDSAAQARSIDLGQFVVYFKQKLVQAPLGEVKPPGVTDPPAAAQPPKVDSPSKPSETRNDGTNYFTR